MQFQAGILSIGTEVTDGQIINSNASFLAEELTALGFKVIQHMAVPDDAALMKEALDILSERSDYLFVTGGLGPTSDDFTRYVVADWLGQALVFNDESWQRLQARLVKINRVGLPTQEVQCYFPADATAIQNHEGLAEAFAAERSSTTGTSKKIWVFPGPPLELASCWGEVRDTLKAVVPHEAKTELYTWHTLGLPESVVANKVSEALEGCSLQLGYRVFFPYVEVKLWIPTAAWDRENHWLKMVENTLAEWIVGRNGEDLAEKLFAKLAGKSVRFIDTFSQGLLFERLQPFLAKHDRPSEILSAWYPAAHPNLPSVDFEFAFLGHPQDPFTVQVSRSGAVDFLEDVATPYSHNYPKHRHIKFLVEKALLLWLA